VIDSAPGLIRAVEEGLPRSLRQRGLAHRVLVRALSKEVRSPLTGKNFEPVSLGQVVAA
jgi:hypothetical protein